MLRSRDNATSRRNVLRGFTAGLAGVALPQWTRLGLAAEGIVVTRLTDSLAMLSGGGGNQLVLSTVDGQVVVDSGAADSRGAVFATLAELPGEAVTALFNTHWHPDQVGSNEALGSDGATIFAHEKTRQRLTTGYYQPEQDDYVAPLPTAGLPTETIYDQGAVQIGGQPIEYGYLIEAHTDGDVYVAFPGANVIAVGDAASGERDPVFDWYGGGWLGGRLDSLMLLLEMSDGQTRFVPSYGPVLNRSDIEAEHDMMLELFERIVERVRLGETARDMLNAGVLEGLGREFAEPYRLLYDLQKGFWAHHNKLMHDIV
jgi:glyoxylase-like metal-dependent hydrolase (beta-lactamase superfamily II)